jgi:hypothetical protein
VSALHIVNKKAKKTIYFSNAMLAFFTMAPLIGRGVLFGGK